MTDFDMPIVYEDRAKLHTARWKLAGVKTLAAGNTDGGWLWLKASKSGNDLTIDLYKAPACQSSDKVATGSADISDIENEAAKLTLAEANSSGMSGECYVHDYTEDVTTAVPVCVTLCVDADLAMHYLNLEGLPGYDATVGMANYCATATTDVLLRVSQQYRDQLGGYGAPEHRRLDGAARLVPDLRCIAAPKQLREAAVHYALALAFGAGHDMADPTMYSENANRHQALYDRACAAWNLTLNINPDTDADADTAGSAGAARLTRV